VFWRARRLGFTGIPPSRTSSLLQRPRLAAITVFNVGADLPAKALCQAADASWMYRPLRGQVRSHGDCAKPTVQRRISVGDNLLASQTTRLHRHTALANKFAPTEGRDSRPSRYSMWELRISVGARLAREGDVSGGRHLSDVPASSRTSPLPRDLRQTDCSATDLCRRQLVGEPDDSF
jgi:hypothetical protein